MIIGTLILIAVLASIHAMWTTCWWLFVLLLVLLRYTEGGLTALVAIVMVVFWLISIVTVFGIATIG